MSREFVLERAMESGRINVALLSLEAVDLPVPQAGPVRSGLLRWLIVRFRRTVRAAGLHRARNVGRPMPVDVGVPCGAD